MPDAFAISVHSDPKSRKRSLDEVIADLAARQHGVVARRQLLRAGVGAGAIALRLRRKRLHPLHAGIYAVGHSVVTREGRWMGAVLAGGPGATLSHLAAAALWGVVAPRSRRADVTTSRRLHRPGIHLHISSLPPDEVTTHNCIPVSTITRTLFDCAGDVSLHQLRRMAHEAEIRRLWDALSLADLLERHPRRPGAPLIRQLIGAPDAGFTRGGLEERFLEFLESYRLPRPATNVTFYLDGIWIEADCAWRNERLIVELDDHTTHSTRFAYERDRARDRALVAAGWRVIRITWRQLRDEPDAVAADLRAALAGAARH